MSTNQKLEAKDNFLNGATLRSCKKTAFKTGISKQPIYKMIVKEYKINRTLQSSEKIKMYKSDEFYLKAVRKICEFYFFQNEILTVDKVLKIFSEDKDIPNFAVSPFTFS